MFRVLFTFPSRYWFTIGLSGVFSLNGWSRQIHTRFHVPRATQDTTIGNGLYLYRAITCYGHAFQRILIHNTPNIVVLQPQYCRNNIGWANPRSLATTNGITIVFSSSGYLDVSVHRVCPLTGNMSSTCWVAPFGNLRINRYVPLPVAYRSLSRPSSPLKA